MAIFFFRLDPQWSDSNIELDAIGDTFPLRTPTGSGRAPAQWAGWRRDATTKLNRSPAADRTAVDGGTAISALSPCGYLGQTRQLASRQLASSTLAMALSYLPNSGDRRLAQISNTGLVGTQTSVFAFTTTPENFITGITETSDAATVYPATGT